MEKALLEIENLHVKLKESGEEIIKGLTKTIDKLRKEKELLWEYKEAFFNIENRCRELTRRLKIKRNTVRITGYKKDDLSTGYILQIIDKIDTPEGMSIKVQLV